jgi:hypothetical protein
MIAWLKGLDSDSIRRVLETIPWGWSVSDFKSMAQFVDSVSVEAVPSAVYAILARQMARQNPMEAMEWANHLPGDQSLIAGADAFAEWRISQPDIAMKWLNDLPPEDPRRQPFLKSAIQTLAYHPQAAEQFASMTPSDRAFAREIIATLSIPQDRRNQLLEALH